MFYPDSGTVLHSIDLRFLCSKQAMVRTVKPGDEAQTLVPSELNMAALSMLPEATRLRTV